jgi:16S rRNA processing protein RimM
VRGAPPHAMRRGAPVDRTQPADAPVADRRELIELGRIVGRHGVRGEVRLLPHDPDSDAVLDDRPVLLRGRDGTAQWRHVAASRPHKRFMLLTFAGIASANDADALVGATVAIARAQLPPPPPGAVYHADLVGCAVQTTAGTALGTVRELIVTGSNDVCVVRGTGREYLIPLIADVIARLDVAARSIVVHPLPGLLDA